jgi:hypothetical protein
MAHVRYYSTPGYLCFNVHGRLARTSSYIYVANLMALGGLGIDSSSSPQAYPQKIPHVHVAISMHAGFSGLDRKY